MYAQAYGTYMAYTRCPQKRPHPLRKFQNVQNYQALRNYNLTA